MLEVSLIESTGGNQHFPRVRWRIFPLGPGWNSPPWRKGWFRWNLLERLVEIIRCERCRRVIVEAMRGLNVQTQKANRGRTPRP